MIDFDVAYDKLASLETADEIADLFRDYGIKAVPQEARACAITVWMEGMTGLHISTGVKSMKIVIPEAGDPLDYKSIASTLRQHSPAMEHFVAKFDSREYPDLIK